MDIKNVDLIWENFVKNSKAIVTEVSPAYDYKDGQRLDKVVGLKVTVVFPGNHYDTLTVKVADPVRELDDEYLDTSLVEKGITVIYRDSRYKKKIRVLVNAGMVVDDPSDIDNLLRKIDKRIAGYFNHNYGLDDSHCPV